MEKEINELELEHPELRLITEQHKIMYMRVMHIKDKKQMSDEADKVIDLICKDIRFTGNKFIVVGTMTNYMLGGITDLLKEINI